MKTEDGSPFGAGDGMEEGRGAVGAEDGFFMGAVVHSASGSPNGQPQTSVRSVPSCSIPS